MRDSASCRAEERGRQIPAYPMIATPGPILAGRARRRSDRDRRRPVPGCGNGGSMEITERFPQDLGNLAQNARFPHFHKPPFVPPHKRKDQEARTLRVPARRRV